MENTSSKIWEVLQNENNFLIPLHLSPDGDMVASALAMREVLLRMGKKVRVVCEDSLGVESNIDFIISAREIIEAETPLGLDELDEPVILVCLDAEALYRYTTQEFKIPHPMVKMIINIDHHEGNNKKLGNLSLVDPQGSAAQVLLHLLEEWGVEIDRFLARILMYGVYSDTVGLRAVSATQEVFRDLALLSSKGAEWFEFITNIDWKVPQKTLWFLRDLLNKVNFDPKNGMLWVTIPLSLSEQYPKDEVDMDYIKDAVLKVMDGSKIVCILREKEDRSVTLSLRLGDASSVLDLGKLARLVSPVKGGGHPAAAGAKLENTTLEEAEKRFIEVTREFLGNSG